MGLNIDQWTYIPEFTRDEAEYARQISEGASESYAAGASVRRGEHASFRHVSGAMVDCVTTTCLEADMLEAEGKDDEAADIRAMCSGNMDAFHRVFKTGHIPKCQCGSGFYPWTLTINGTKTRVCDRCMPPRPELRAP